MEPWLPLVGVAVGAILTGAYSLIDRHLQVKAMQLQRDHERALAHDKRARGARAESQQLRVKVHDEMLASLVDFRHELIEGFFDNKIALKHSQVYLAYMRLAAVDPGEESEKAADALESYWALRGHKVSGADRVVADADRMLHAYVSSLTAHLYTLVEQKPAR